MSATVRTLGCTPLAGRKATVTDPYADGVYRWWHLSRVPPELLAAESDRRLGKPGNVLDIGCGLGVELAHLAQHGWQCCGIDVSAIALQRARADQAEVAFIRADALRLPFTARAFDLVLDRGCFQYLDPRQRRAYWVEAERVLRPDGRMLLRACLNCAGIRNDITEAVITSVFARPVDFLKPVQVPSDTRDMPALEVRLRRKA
jgi:SAM-dependent methyltransferase